MWKWWKCRPFLSCSLLSASNTTICAAPKDAVYPVSIEGGSKSLHWSGGTWRGHGLCFGVRGALTSSRPTQLPLSHSRGAHINTVPSRESLGLCQLGKRLWGWILNRSLWAAMGHAVGGMYVFVFAYDEIGKKKKKSTITNKQTAAAKGNLGRIQLAVHYSAHS